MTEKMNLSTEGLSSFETSRLKTLVDVSSSEFAKLKEEADKVVTYAVDGTNEVYKRMLDDAAIYLEKQCKGYRMSRMIVKVIQSSEGLVMCDMETLSDFIATYSSDMEATWGMYENPDFVPKQLRVELTVGLKNK